MTLNFTISEFIHSDTAVKYKINNMPDIQSLDNLLNTILFAQDVRILIKRPMIITSGFRSKALNQKIGGAQNSAHLYGRAFDFVVNGLSTRQICMMIRNSQLKYTQLIEEHGKNGDWTHIEYNPKNLKREYLVYQNGKYIKI